MKVVEQLKHISEPGFLSIYEALAQDGFGPLDHKVAEALRFRPQAIRKLPMAKRAKKARSILITSGQAELCYELFGSYLIQHRKDLVTGFLDATGVEHEEGMIEQLEENEPDPKKIPAAVKDLDSKFEADDVTLYLALAAEQWPSLAALDEAWRARIGAEVGS
jgi:hypothetical protein